jgi:predicted nucleic acid-binding Zn ribbon protein
MKHCKNKSCGQPFEPKRRSQEHCSDECRLNAAKHRMRNQRRVEKRSGLK